MNPADEIVAIVDAHNNVIGSAPRREMRANKLPHRSTYILVFNSQRELFVQKRTMTKDIYPGYYDPCTGGVVLHGESYEVSAIRELEEEVGIRDVPLTWHFHVYFKDDLVRVWGACFHVCTTAWSSCRRKKWRAASFWPLTPFCSGHKLPLIRRIV